MLRVFFLFLEIVPGNSFLSGEMFFFIPGKCGIFVKYCKI